MGTRNHPHSCPAVGNTVQVSSLKMQREEKEREVHKVLVSVQCCGDFKS